MDTKTAIGEIRNEVFLIRQILRTLEHRPEVSSAFRACDTLIEFTDKYERGILRTAEEEMFGTKATPLCIKHGKPITLEDPECEVCKSE
jgi:hypothetical protein